MAHRAYAIECDVTKVLVDRSHCVVRLKPIDRDEDHEFDLQVPHDVALEIAGRIHASVSISLVWNRGEG